MSRKVYIVDTPEQRLFAALSQSISLNMETQLMGGGLFFGDNVGTTSNWEEQSISSNDIMDNINEMVKTLDKIPKPKQIFYSEYVMGPGDERLFPESRHRSARIKKKLVKRFGGEFKMAPAIYETPEAFYAHSSFEERISNHD